MTPRTFPVLGRDRELDELGRFAQALSHGSSGALVVHGEAGIGKTTILEHFLSTQASCQVKTISGVESEMELAWAGLHQLCGSMLEYLPKIAAPQSAALRSALGLASEGSPEPFLCGLAVLSLLTEAAEQSPVICFIDDASALDRASLKTLGFVARRLEAESVGLIFAVRDIPRDLVGLPDLSILGLDSAAAGALFDTVARTPLDPTVREQLIAETYGNPLAIVELAERRHFRRLAGGYDIPASGPVSGRLQQSFGSAVEELDPDTRRVLLLAAADPTGDPTLLLRAALASGLEIPRSDDETVTRLVSFAPSVRFRHPLVRSAIYAAATDADRRAAHRALAEAFSSDSDPDRRVWHLAQSLDGPDEQIADALERSAVGARARGGWAAAAAFLSRAAEITADPARRAGRELDAAVAHFHSGDAQGALVLLASARARGLDDRLLAHAQLLRGQIDLYLAHGGDAPALLLGAARALKRFDAPLSRETYLEAVQSAGFAGLLSPGATVGSIARAALAEAPAVERMRPVDLLLDAICRFYTDGAAAAAPAARAANEALLADHALSQETVRWMVLGANLAFETFDDELVVALTERAVTIARESGRVLLFVMAAWMLTGAKTLSGDLVGADALFREAKAVAEAADAPVPEFALLGVTAWRGDIERSEELAASLVRAAKDRNEGHVLRFVDGITALLRNSTGEYRAALDLCQRMLEGDNPTYGIVVAFEYGESASRAGTDEEIVVAHEYLSTLTGAAHTGWTRGLRAIARALLDDTVDAESSYRESIAEFATTPLLPYLARVHLLFGEWLRRTGQRHESRSHLRIAFNLLSDIGCDAFAARAARELKLLGERGRRRPPAIDDELTPQELQIAQLAASGLRNRQIAERIFLSHRTVASHLYRVYPKLGITSRNQLHLVLEQRPRVEAGPPH